MQIKSKLLTPEDLSKAPEVKPVFSTALPPQIAVGVPVIQVAIVNQTEFDIVPNSGSSNLNKDQKLHHVHNGTAFYPASIEPVKKFSAASFFVHGVVPVPDEKQFAQGTICAALSLQVSIDNSSVQSFSVGIVSRLNRTPYGETREYLSGVTRNAEAEIAVLRAYERNIQDFSAKLFFTDTKGDASKVLRILCVVSTDGPKTTLTFTEVRNNK